MQQDGPWRWIPEKIIVYTSISYLCNFFISSVCFFLLFLFQGSSPTSSLLHHQDSTAGRTQEEQVAGARSCTGQLDHPPAHWARVHLVTRCLLWLWYIFTSTSANTGSLLTCPWFTPKQCERRMSAERCCLTAVLTWLTQLWIQGRRQWKIRNRIAKDAINNVCEVNWNLGYVSREPLLVHCFVFLEGGEGGADPSQLTLLPKQQKKSLEAI